mmetsp:Transcript_21361/g.33209  ORF Transcript_21361/g.33209 Transcript_21361/m.33209 type:complete len:223 (-) Transcript_21361:159-827(-)
MYSLNFLFTTALYGLSNDDIHRDQHESMLLMIGLYGITHSLRRELVSRRFVRDGDRMNNVCAWNGVSCAQNSNVITKISWAKSQVPIRMELGWIPPTTQELILKNVSVNTQINTRVLPRDLKVCEMTKCGLRGELDLQTLPQKQLKSVSLENNCLAGRIHFVSLPATIERINLSNNRFRSLVIVNSSLPDGFESAIIKTDRKLSIIVLDDKKIDSRVRISQF